MIYPQLVEYIKKSLEKKIPLSQTKQSLLTKGWRKSDIDEAISLINKNQKNFPEVKSKIKNKPLINYLLILGIVVLIFILAAGFVIYFAMIMPKEISDIDILQGVSIKIGSGKGINFNFDNEKHRIAVTSINLDSADITVYSLPISRTFFVGQEQGFDLNDDNINDLSVRLENITKQKAIFYIQGFFESICTEFWECSDWTVCADGIQNRICTDANNCGTETNKLRNVIYNVYNKKL